MRSKRDVEIQTISDENRQGRMHGMTGRVERADEAMTPRLFGLEDAARYLGLSPGTIRDLEAKGVLPRVRVP